MAAEQIIFDTARADGIPDTMAKIIVAQAQHETGNFKSRFFVQGNNAFGYSYVSGAKWQLPEPGPIADNGAATARYATVQNSVHELTDWIRRRQKENKFPKTLSEITTPEIYSYYLKMAGYYGATYETYTNALRYWFNKLPALNSGGGLFLLAALIFVFRKHLGM